MRVLGGEDYFKGLSPMLQAFLGKKKKARPNIECFGFRRGCSPPFLQEGGSMQPGHPTMLPQERR